MAEILKEWLTERLQRPIKWEAADFGQIMKNGYVIADVLLSYHVINEEQYFLIRDSIASADVKNNWRYLSQWLRDLDVCLSESDLNSIQEGKGSSLLRLFYQLFLHLDKRDRTNFIKREKQMVSTLVEKLNNRFKIDKVEETPESFVDDLSRPLLNEKHFVEWQRKKTEQMKETYDYIRHKYSKMLSKIEENKTPINYVAPKPARQPSKEKQEMDKFALRYPCKYQNYTYEELVSLDEKSTERKKSLVGSDWAKEYMDNLYSRMDKKSDSEEFQTQLKNTLSTSLWDLSVAEEETAIDTQLSKKVLKLSQFEKQMCTQIMETKQQARNIIKNRVRAERDFAAQRDHQFHQFLDNLKDQIHLEVVEMDFEKHRQNMLHEKLYAEKMKRKRQLYYEICYDTLLALVDYAAKYGYFKRLIGDDIPDHFIHEWKNLFFRRQPIFDILDPLENILKQQGLEEEPVQEVEEIIRLELDRQDALNDEEFIEYNEYLYPWDLNLLLPNFDLESEERKYEYLGSRILGHMIYTLLDIKYPYPPPRPPANLPNYTSKVIISGLPDRSIVVPMQTLLNKSKVHVVRLECAINFCLREFRYEMVGCTDIELNFDKFIAAAQDEEGKEFVRVLKAEDDHTKSIETAHTGVSHTGPTPAIPPNTKQTQTPKTIPEVEIKLSTAAELGKYAYEALGLGDSLTDHLLAAMVVEYLKDQDNINGFVIINYPNSYRETQILEETFSGREPPDPQLLKDRDDIFLEESIIKHRKKEKDPFKEIRKSKLVKDPHKKRVETPFESYFTCYIKLKETDDILQEVVIWDLNEENSELIDRFYALLGINYSMYFEIIEKDLLAQICKYIVGDLTMPQKSIDNLFGENVYSQLDFPLSEAKKTKSKIVKPDASMLAGKSKDKMRSKGKISKSSLSGIDMYKSPESIEEVTDEPTAVIDHVQSEEHEIKSIEEVEEVKLLAGEEDWDYGEIPISDIIGIALATCWEEIEKGYIHDLEQMFFAKRMQMNCLVPYSRFIKDKMEQIITLPSYKQDLVSRFQKEYNDFEDDWRDVNLTKNEWHCRVKELEEKLCSICDERKLYAEQQRQALIADNWALEELTTMANTYISCMQVELNRFYLTMQAFHDFYFAMLKRLPPTDRISASKELTKILRETDDVTNKKGDKEDKQFKQLKTVYQDMLMKNISIEYSNNPFNLIIENNVRNAQKLIKDSNDFYRTLISKEYSEVAKIVVPVKKKDDNSSEETVNNAEEIFKCNALKCIEEWIMGINGEMYRANLRMLVLQAKCYVDMKLFNDHIFKAFIDIQNDIDKYYMNEINSVNRLCKYVQMAVENGRKIPETLVLEHDVFIIDPNLLQFPPLEPPAGIGDGVEVVDGMNFKISQLARIRTQFKIVAPTGLALQQAFIYLLQDFIFFGKESCEGTIFPEIWRRIDPEQVPKLVFILFGETAYVDWKDFLIYCLNIRFPTVEELLNLRHRFRCHDLNCTELISRDDFIKEEFWFESEFAPEDRFARLRKNLIKHFLFELYETSQDMMNYSAFLLAFCKSANPVEGFASALAMATGKKVAYSFEECEEVVCNFIKYKQYKDQCMQCALKCTKNFLNNLLIKVIDICEGTTIVDIPYSEIDEKKGKGKGKGKSKSKEPQSARLPKKKSSMEANTSKLTQSAVDVKLTYICPPCEAPSPEEKPVEKEEAEEEEHVAQPDPNVSYAVSQEVIWKVLRICLPWHFVLVPEAQKTPYVDQVQEAMEKLQGNHDNGDIFVSLFVSEPDICLLLNKVKKFRALNMIKEIQNICV